MSTTWIFSSTFLPYTGEPIDFQLEDRAEPIHGTFVDGAFHSRWAGYDVDRVPAWRHAMVDASHEVIAAPGVAKRRGWFAPLARLAGLFRINADRPASTKPVLDHARSRVNPVRPVPTASVATHHRFDSNQISS